MSWGAGGEPFTLPNSQSTFRRTEVCLDTPGSGVSQSGMGELCKGMEPTSISEIGQFEIVGGRGHCFHTRLTLHALTLGLPSSCFIAMLKTMSCEPFSGELDSAI